VLYDDGDERRYDLSKRRIVYLADKDQACDGPLRPANSYLGIRAMRALSTEHQYWGGLCTNVLRRLCVCVPRVLD